MAHTTRWIVVDDTDPNIHYTGSGWFQDQGSRDSIGNFGAPYRSTLHGTSVDGSLSFAFNGTQVSVLGANNLRNDSGVYDPTYECFVDGNPITTTLPFQFPENQWKFCYTDTLPDTPHVLTVNATIKTGQTFWFDQIQYAPSPSVSLDGATVLIPSDDFGLTYAGGWESLPNTSTQSTNAAGSSVVFNFTGISLGWYGVIPSNYPLEVGSATYVIDDQDPQVFSVLGLTSSSQASAYNTLRFQTADYPAGSHTIKITYLGNSSVAPLTMDYLIVQNGTSSSTTDTETSSVPLNPSTNLSTKKEFGPITGGVIGGVLVLSLMALTMLALFRYRWRCTRMKTAKIEVDPEEGSKFNPFGRVKSKHSAQRASDKYPVYFEGVGQDDNTQARSRQNSNITEFDFLIPRYREAAPIQPVEEAMSPNSKHDWRTGWNKVKRMSTVVLQPPSPSQESPFFGSSRLVVHEDSGLRLPRKGKKKKRSKVVEVPPVYTES